MSFKLMKRVSDMEDKILALENAQSVSEPLQSAIKRIDGEIKMLKARMARGQKEDQRLIVENYDL